MEKLYKLEDLGDGIKYIIFEQVVGLNNGIIIGTNSQFKTTMSDVRQMYYRELSKDNSYNIDIISIIHKAREMELDWPDEDNLEFKYDVDDLIKEFQTIPAVYVTLEDNCITSVKLIK